MKETLKKKTAMPFVKTSGILNKYIKYIKVRNFS